MTLLTLLVTHLPAARVEAQLAGLQALAPATRVAAAYGGPRAEFDRLAPGTPAVFVEDPSLRGPLHDQSYTELLLAAHAAFVAPEEDVDLVFVAEYDHAILDPAYEARLRAVRDATGADLLAHNLSRRNDTNWEHYLRLRGDASFEAFLERISTREDRRAVYGALGTGTLISRAALDAFCALDAHHPCYLEVYLPTVLHHLGFAVCDLAAVSDLTRHVRSHPPYSAAELARLRAQGAVFVHPYKG